MSSGLHRTPWGTPPTRRSIRLGSFAVMSALDGGLNRSTSAGKKTQTATALRSSCRGFSSDTECRSTKAKIVATPPVGITFLNNRDLTALNVRRTNPFRRNDDTASATRGHVGKHPGTEVVPGATAQTGPR
jgi:hypothetical protein